MIRRLCPLPLRAAWSLAFALLAVGLAGTAARAQPIDLSHGGQITVTARGGFDWDQKAQTVTAYRDAQAVRGNVTVTADRLVAFYRKKAGTVAKPVVAANQGAGSADDTGANEIYRLEAWGHVHIFTATDQAWGDHAIYDIDQAVLVLTGHDLHLTTPTDLLTARDSMEYWSRPRMSVGRGDATVTSNDGRRIRADVLVGYSAPPDPNKPQPQGKATAPGAVPAKPANADPIESSGKLQKVDAFGHVVVRTRTETVTGERGVYVPDTGIARIVGNVHITRGQNQLNGAAAIVNMHTGLATMTEAPGARVQGLIVPNDNNGAPGAPHPGGAQPGGVQSGGVQSGNAKASKPAERLQP
jgi:lipopolysaccharide export system protein LptA